MKCHALMSLLAAAGAVTTGAAASLDMTGSMPRAFRMAVLPRQQQASNLQAFSGALGGVSASAITQSNDPTRQFEVDGDTFNDFPTAANRACDNQHNKCADLANSKKGAFTVQQCDEQSTQCKAAISSAPKTSFVSLFQSNDDFDIFCDT
ncbi:hypothetical protein VTK73DRAFT_9550 [Phialemonium thermophilum]|uniref:Uncharacterized protein n=1 Tax=Phialemonium thermophilum TaxID=223376 RepID=A0ABR3W1S8_9PEZI